MSEPRVCSSSPAALWTSTEPSPPAPAAGAAPPPAAAEDAAANTLCALGTARGIDCTVVAEPGKHDWPFAGRAFAATLPWLAGQINTPGVPRSPPPATVAP